MTITPALLATIRSLDDLHGFVAALGYDPAGDDLSRAARARLGLSGAGIRRAGLVGRRESFLLYAAQFDEAPRARVAQVVERLARATPGERNLLLALDGGGATLAVATWAPDGTAFRARQLRISLADPSPVAADILSRLAPQPGETTLDLSIRCGDVLAEEGLTHRFFVEFAASHDRAAAALTGVPRATTSERRDLALVILTRVLFLYFVQAKGWLAGRRDFLPSLLDTALRQGHPFHRAAFEPLCFGALAAPRAARRGLARAMPVPFLNGGLFERHALERRFPAAALPNSAWTALFDGLFERFRFTVREREDADAVNPEMLGRVFEGLMATDRRRSAGAYYTPPDLLRDTVRAALDAALAASDRNRLAHVRILDPAVGSGAFLLEALYQLEARHQAPEGGRAALRRTIVRDNLFGVDVDPMAVRLAELRLWLALVVDDATGWETVAPLPNLDQNLRQGDSLLSPLDYARGTQVPLPRERLMRVAEHRAAYYAAAGPDKAKLARALRGDEAALATAITDAAVTSLTAKLADAASLTSRDLFGKRGERSRRTQQRVAEWRARRRDLLGVRRRIAGDGDLPFFAYDVHFGDVVAGGGFDIILGNPPWVRGERLPAATRRSLTQRFRTFQPDAAGRGFAHIPDLSAAFVERALELARDDGVIALIVPAKLLRAGYAGRLRGMLRRETTVLALDDRAHAPETGFAATVFPLVMVLRRARPHPATPARVRLATAAGAHLEGAARQDELGLDAAPSPAAWLALPGDVVRALRAALRAGPRLGARFHPRLGVKTGANEIFVRPRARADELPAACRCDAIQGRDLAAFRIEPGAAILAPVDCTGAPLRTVPREVAEYLRPHHAALARRADADGAPPWALFRTDLLRGSWLVLWRDIAPRLEAAALHRAPGGPVPLNSCYGVTVPDAPTAFWLSAWLNAAPLRAVARLLAERASGGAWRFSAGVVAALPLPALANAAAVRALTTIGQTAYEGGSWDDDALARQAAAALGLGGTVVAKLAALDAALR